MVPSKIHPTLAITIQEDNSISNVAAIVSSSTNNQSSDKHHLEVREQPVLAVDFNNYIQSYSGEKESPTTPTPPNFLSKNISNKIEDTKDRIGNSASQKIAQAPPQLHMFTAPTLPNLVIDTVSVIPDETVAAFKPTPSATQVESKKSVMDKALIMEDVIIQDKAGNLCIISRPKKSFTLP